MLLKLEDRIFEKLTLKYSHRTKFIFMKLKVISLAITLAFLLSACGKKVVCEGTVFSKKGAGNIPVANVVVAIHQFTSGSDEALKGSFSATTDENGHFRIFERAVSKNRSFSLSCDCNEGSFYKKNLSREDLKQYNIHLK